MNSYFPRRSTRGHHYRQNPLTVRYQKRSLLVHMIWLSRRNYVNINIVVWWGRHSGNCFGIFTHIYMKDAYFLFVYFAIFSYATKHVSCARYSVFPCIWQVDLNLSDISEENMMPTKSTCICSHNLSPSVEWPHNWYFELVVINSGKMKIIMLPQEW